MELKRNFGTTNDGHLCLHGIDLVELGNKYGTPLFVFDEDNLVENFAQVSHAFENVYPKVMVCYSVKTNNNVAVCQILREKGAFAEVSSDLDLNVALRAGFSGQKIIFDGPFKPKETLREAIEKKVLLINVESFAEMERLDDVAGEMGVKQPIGLRINPWQAPHFYDYVHPGRITESATFNLGSRFGFSLENAYDAFGKAREFGNLSVEGIMTHPYHTAAKVLPPLMQEIHSKLGVEIKYLNIGGGFNPGVTRSLGGMDLVKDFLRRKVGRKSNLTVEMHAGNINSLADSVTDEIRQGIVGLPEPFIVVEPGKYISASPGILLAKVDHVKKAGGYTWVIVDGGTNLVPNSLGGKELRKAVVANRASSTPEEQVNVVGPLLYGEDFLTFQANLPKIQSGDTLAIFACGAYTLSMSTQFLHARPAAVLLNSKSEVRVIREKETFEDFLHKDKPI